MLAYKHDGKEHHRSGMRMCRFSTAAEQERKESNTGLRYSPQLIESFVSNIVAISVDHPSKFEDS